MEIFDSKNNCCGCSACEQICPKNAIKMKPDDRGFLYPVIDNSLCVECGACKRVCAFQNGYEKNRAQKAYAIKHLSATDLKVQNMYKVMSRIHFLMLNRISKTVCMFFFQERPVKLAD